jgi:hypothetical protein
MTLQNLPRTYIPLEVGLYMLIRNRELQKVNAKHQLLVDLAEKDELFDKAAAKYAPKVAS